MAKLSDAALILRGYRKGKLRAASQDDMFRRNVVHREKSKSEVPTVRVLHDILLEGRELKKMSKFFPTE